MNETYTFTNKQTNVRVAPPYNTRIIVVRDEKLLIMPTLGNLVKYHTRHITAPFRWIMDIPQRYALY